jgi:hypothetical protein
MGLVSGQQHSLDNAHSLDTAQREFQELLKNTAEMEAMPCSG